MIVVFEDDDNKYRDIENVLENKGVHSSRIKRVTNVAQFVSIKTADIDLCIIDIIMPNVDGGDRRSTAGIEILNMLDYSNLQRVPVLAITAYPDEMEGIKDKFLSRGCIVFDYEARDNWIRAMDIFIAQAQDRGRYEFIIFTGLAKERAAFASLPGFSFESVVRNGIDHWECQIGGRQGTIVVMPRMGLVNAAVTVGRVLEQYSPKVCAMSGICGGIGAGSKLGQLLVTELCWEYQSGKWFDEAFEAEPYQVSIHPDLRIRLNKILEDKTLITELESGFPGDCRPSQKSEPKLAIFATGSAVIASAQRLESLKKQHRKVAGIDMEIFGFHMAAEMINRDLPTFSAKVVVDKADEAKDDQLHLYGSFVSAQFVKKAIEKLLC